MICGNANADVDIRNNGICFMYMRHMQSITRLAEVKCRKIRRCRRIGGCRHKVMLCISRCTSVLRLLRTRTISIGRQPGNCLCVQA